MSKKTPEGQAVDSGRRSFVTWLWRLPVLAVLGGALYGAYEFYRIQFRRTKANPQPRFTPGPPQAISDLSDLSTPWSLAEFIYEGVPALALHTPEPAPGGVSLEGQHFVAFSRICTHQGCIVNLNDNEEALATLYNHRSREPALACNCHFSVFLPLRGGEAVSGPALTPLPRVGLEVKEGMLYAVGLEQI